MKKAVELKSLQQQATKEREWHQCRIEQLDQFQEDTENLTLKAMEILATTKEAQTKVLKVSEDDHMEKEFKECITLSTKIKEEVEQMRKEHKNFKAKLNEPTMSS